MEKHADSLVFELMLPGLEIEPEYAGHRSQLRTAVTATLESLARQGLLREEHAALSQLALELADAVAAGRRGGRASAAAMAAAQLRETLMALPQPVTKAGESWEERARKLLDKVVVDE